MSRINHAGLVIVVLCALMLVGCGTFTGIPSHGGGKRFAVEQEIISASARAAARYADVSPLVGKRCALYVISIGDEGSGNLIGGRYEWQAAIRGEYINSAQTRSTYNYPIIPSQTTSVTGAIETVTDVENVLNAPSSSRQETKGENFNAVAGANYSGPGAYRAEAFINPLDAQFLRAVIHELLMLRGVIVVPPERAEVDVYVTVDVFGTHRRRKEYHLYNEERLLAKTAFEMTAFDRDRNVVMRPMTSSWEAEYIERYLFWCGPISTDKQVRPSDGPLVTYRSVPVAKADKGDGAPDVPAAPEVERTRPNILTQPLPAPVPSRPEDVK